jgi:hypothetical protein
MKFLTAFARANPYPQRAKKDWRIKSDLGFLAKEPASYGQKTTLSLLSDDNNAVLVIEDFLTALESSEFEPRLAGFHKTIQRNKTSVQRSRRSVYALSKDSRTVWTYTTTERVYFLSLSSP